jgi:hypothetical protein
MGFDAVYDVEILLATCFHAGLFLGLFLDPPDVGICSSETSINFQMTARRHIPKYRTFHNYRLGNHKSYMNCRSFPIIVNKIVCSNAAVNST